MGYWIVFIEGPESVKKRMFKDPPMHEECARYAFVTCPFVTGAKPDYAKIESVQKKHKAAEVFSVDANMDSKRPDKMGFYLTRQYETEISGTEQYFHAAAPKSVEWLEARSDHG